MADNVIPFYSDTSDDANTFKNRTNSLYTFRNRLETLLSRNRFPAIDDYSRFLRLKAIDANKPDVQHSNTNSNPDSPIQSSILNDKESAAIQSAVEGLQASEFVQLFLDMYMSPVNSDIDFRLGKVVGIKTFLYNDFGKIIPDWASYGQYDQYGRMDTTLNLRYEVDIPSFGNKIGWEYFWGHNKMSTLPGLFYNRLSYEPTWHPTNRGWTDFRYFSAGVFPGYKEKYVNFFFPPYNRNNYAGYSVENLTADWYIKRRRWNYAKKKWEYPDGFDPDLVTYDTYNLLSMRKNPTYRLPAYKAINDNIQFLQYIFENTCGVVSTYLTEWDISLYIQEGLITDKKGKMPSILTLTNRIMMDNPANYKDTRAFAFGALNCAVSKTPLGVPLPNESEWMVSAYPYSTYWMPYITTNRGDGLDVMYDVGQEGFDSYNLMAHRTGMSRITAEARYSANHYSGLRFREKLARDDQIGAAYSGWKNWDRLYYWQALYTWPDDGFSQIDIIHMSEDPTETKFNDTIDDEGNKINGEISEIIDGLYAEDGDLGVGDNAWETEEQIQVHVPEPNGKLQPRTKITKWHRNGAGEEICDGWTLYNDDDGTEEQYDGKGNKVNPDSLSVDASDYRVMRITIKGSRILKVFLKKSKYKDAAMAIANKNQNNGGYPTATPNGGGVQLGASGTGSNNSSNGSGSISSSGTNGSGSGSGNSGSSSSSGSNSNGSGSNSGTSASTMFAASMMDSDENENGQYSRTSGISQWSPVLYGGPHGKNFSPKTVEGYFESDNDFFKNIPRIGYDLSTNLNKNFFGLEHKYSAKGDPRDLNASLRGTEPFRSPSRCYNLMREGYCDFTSQAVYVRRREYFWSETPSGYKGGEYYWKVGFSLGNKVIDTGYITPVEWYCNTNIGDYYPSCPHWWYQSWYEWNNFEYYASCWGYGYRYYYNSYRYYNSNVYAYSYRKDYWGQLRNVCLWDTQVHGYGRYTYRRTYHYHGNVRAYMLKVVQRRYLYYCARDYWTTYYYKRPLMHSNPNASNNSFWSINCAYTGNVFTKPYNKWWLKYWFKRISNTIEMYAALQPQENTEAYVGGLSTKRYYPSVALAYSDPEEHYRLTFPYSPVKVNNKLPWGYNADVRTKEELTFLEYVTGNSETGWHNVYFFQSEFPNLSDRKNNGPDLIFMAPVKRSEYSTTIEHWYYTEHKRGCRWYGCWHLETQVVKVPYIEVDMHAVSQVWTGFKTEGINSARVWNNLNTSLLAGNRQEAYMDVPPDSYRMSKFPDSPYGYAYHTAYGYGVTQTWAGMFGKEWDEMACFGWGYATTMPGIEYYEPDPNGIFENPNYYLNLQKVYGSWIKYTRVQDLVNFLPFYTLDNNLPLRKITGAEGSLHNYIDIAGVKRYSRISSLDNGLKKVFRNMFATSTFFKFKEQDLYAVLHPILTTNDNGLRTLARIVNHQLAWTKRAQQLYLNNVDFNEVFNLINTTVNKVILAKTLPGSESRDSESVFYHYWIEKAYGIFSNPANKQNISDAFNRRISSLSYFLTRVSSYLMKSSYEWSFNNYKEVYSMVNDLRNSTVNYTTQWGDRDETMEEYMYAYLNVLYEYRKFYINKRCNKVDGTLYKMRMLEGAIPEVTVKTMPFDPAGPGKTNTIFDTDEHKYNVDFYGVDNSNFNKVKALTDPTYKIPQDRTMLLYITVKYVDDKIALKYIQKCRDGSTTVKDQRYIWVPEKQKYAELPFDGLYKYISAESEENEVISKYNEKADAKHKKQLNTMVDPCIFYIKWTDNFKMTENANGRTPYRNSISDTNDGTKENAPFVYKEDDAWKSRNVIKKEGARLPKIKFDVMSGVDPSLLVAAMPKMDMSDPKGIICTTGLKSDYWVIAIPVSKRPRAGGYLSMLKIVSVPGVKKGDEIVDKMVSSSAGAFGYALYPITEEQANVMPGVGLDLTTYQEMYKKQVLDNFTKKIDQAE